MRNPIDFMNAKQLHDENFKHNFTTTRVLIDFLKHNLPKEILKRVDVERVKMESNELLSSTTRGKRNADIVCSILDKQGRKIYTIIHLEAQSNHDKNMAHRVWEYHVAIARLYRKRGYRKTPIILTFVLYNGKKEWKSERSIAELFDDFDLYVDLSLRTPFLIELTKKSIEQLKQEGAAAAPQMIMKGRAEGDFSQLLPELYPLLKSYNQLDDENIDYMATVNKKGEDDFLEELSKFDTETANNYRVMFERAIEKAVKRESKKALKLGEQRGLKLGEQRGIKLGEQRGLKLGEQRGIKLGEKRGKQEGIKLGREEILGELVKEGLLTQDAVKRVREKDKNSPKK